MRLDDFIRREGCKIKAKNIRALSKDLVHSIYNQFSVQTTQ